MQQPTRGKMERPLRSQSQFHLTFNFSRLNQDVKEFYKNCKRCNVNGLGL